MHVNQASVLFLNSHSDSLKRGRGGGGDGIPESFSVYRSPLFYSTCPEIRKFSFSSLVDVLFSEQKIAKNNSRQKFQCYQNAENKF